MSGPEPPARRRPLGVRPWCSPADQPAWARPALLGAAAVAALLTAWRSGPYLEIYYAAAVRSMSMSWHDFFFAAFDPAGTVSLDKLPGSLWVQALSVRILGVHTWALVAPQVVEGVLTVLVIYRPVRRLCGPVAGIVAAGLLAVSPATVALNRGNVPDSLMILLLVLAADAVVTAVTRHRPRHLLVAGVWVGLAFQAKMIEAWLLLPALVLVVLVAGGGGPAGRFGWVGAMLAVTAAVSLSWMAVVTLVPESSRPYVDGSQHDSVFEQVFVYNGLGRLDQATPDQLLDRSIDLGIPKPPPPSWNRLLAGAVGRDTGWLLPVALVSLVAGLAVTRRRPRQDPLRVACLLWGGWAVVFFVAFSTSSSANSYYTAALSPPVAALVGTASVLLWRERRRHGARIVAAAAVAATLAYALWLLPAEGTGRSAWLVPAAVGLGALAVTTLVLGPLLGRRPAALAPVLAVAAVAFFPAVASATVAADRLGSFDTPFEATALTTGIRAFFDVTATTPALLPALERARNGAPFLMATQTAAVAAPFIFTSGQEVLPIGGFSGTIPSPTLASLRRLVREGKFHLVLQSPTTTDRRLVWVARHCIAVPQPTNVHLATKARLAIFYCNG